MNVPKCPSHSSLPSVLIDSPLLLRALRNWNLEFLNSNQHQRKCSEIRTKQLDNHFCSQLMDYLLAFMSEVGGEGLEKR